MNSLTPKNLDEMREALVGEISPLGEECKKLIETCEELSLPEEGILSIEQAAIRLGVSKQTLRNWETSGKLVPHEKTKCGHRRYLESQVNSIRKKQLSIPEIILPDITLNKLRDLGTALSHEFHPEEKINIILSQGLVENVVVLTVEAEDGIRHFSKTFTVKE